MPKKKPNNHAANLSNSSDFSRINRELYKRNFELAVRNKAFSLLRELYDISLATLNDQQLGRKLVDTIQKGFSAEIVGLFFFDRKLDSQKITNLVPVALAFSERVKQIAENFTKGLADIIIPISCANNLCSKAIRERKVKIVSNLSLARQLIQSDFLISQASKLTHIRSVIICPLVNDRRVLGALLMASARQQKDFSNFELEVINNFTTIITVALDKALIYKELRESTEKMKVLYEMKSNFLTVASHQLRTPVSIVRGMLSMMNEEGMTTQEKLGMAPNAFKAANNLERIIHDILTATEIDSAKLKADLQSLDLLPIIDDTINTLKPKAEEKKLVLNYKKPSPSLPKIMVDTGKIREAITNIIDNAINYTEKGSVDVTLTKITKNRKPFLVLAVKDTGIGMSKEDMAQITEKFYRGKRALSVHPNGSGLGLFIAKGIVEKGGGRLEFESKGKDLGSIFRLLLPTV